MPMFTSWHTLQVQHIVPPVAGFGETEVPLRTPAFHTRVLAKCRSQDALVGGGYQTPPLPYSA